MTKLAFIGFGGVGQTLAELLVERKYSIQDKYSLTTTVVAVSDVMKGSIYHPEGLDISLLLKTLMDTGNVENYPNVPGLYKGWGSIETIKNTNADVVVEVTFTDVKTGQPAIDHCRTAFDHGKSVITTNKGPVALAYKELSALAKSKGQFWGFEGTVMSGTPALRMPTATLAGNEINEIKGILNGTTNYILTEMEKGRTYDAALKQAQELRIAEADPTSDVEGHDTRYKAAILANYVMNSPLDVDDIYCKGIQDMTEERIREATEKNKKWRLIARIKKVGNEVTATVQPELLDADDPLAGVTGATNAILYECDLAGPIMLSGAGAGLVETGYSLLIDLIHFHRQNTTNKIEERVVHDAN